MPALSTELRNQLAKTVIAARREAELGARRALESLAVDCHEPYSSMSSGDRSLRNRLRAHGRQLGDERDKVRGTQSIDRLCHEVAYEHWHRMLFARFLAENGLLIDPDSGVAITMQECEELAREASEGPQEMAARFAQRALPQIFRSGDPVLEVALAPETRQALAGLLDSLSAVIFTASDSLGWTYQFWQSEKKEAVNASGNKVGADELPAVTQLFTEPYMVLFLLHNSIGAWHAGRVFVEDPSVAETAQSEEECRQAVRLRSEGGYDFKYLRFARSARENDDPNRPTGPWRPAAGFFDGWPKTAKELKILDPCCGSGHFLVEMFELLVRLRIDEESIDLESAIRQVLIDNLHGLEIDPRCTQIAAFNLAMAAWKLEGKPIRLPPLLIACSGLAVGSTKNEWKELAGDDERLDTGIERLHDLFSQAFELGSLIDPEALRGDLFEAGFAHLHPLLAQALARNLDEAEKNERAVAAQGMARAAELLLGEYTLVITNVPYLGRGVQSDALKNFGEEHFGEAKADLATIFLDRMLKFLIKGGSVAAVTPQNWLYQAYYRPFRRRFLSTVRWHSLAMLGARAFETITGEIVKPALVTVSTGEASPECSFAGLDATECRTADEKSLFLRHSPVNIIAQKAQLEHAGHRVNFRSKSNLRPLSDFMNYSQGICTGDYPRFGRKYWELPESLDGWSFQQTTARENGEFVGFENRLLWGDGRGELCEFVRARVGKARVGSWLRGESAWRRNGIAISSTGKLAVSLFAGDLYDDSTMVLTPKQPEYLPAAWVFCTSSDYEPAVRMIDKKLNVRGALIDVPFDFDHWHKVAFEKYCHGLPEPQSNDITQWLFHGHPAKATSSAVLQVAVSRLLGYCWPPELDDGIRLAKEARHWVSLCERLGDYADRNGIVCLSPAHGERSAADRLRDLLCTAFGSDWSTAKERDLLSARSDGSRPEVSLSRWLRDYFFEEHCKLFHHRPFVWHIWDGNPAGFHCLVNAHKLTGPEGEGRRTLEAITYSYLGAWIDRKRIDQQQGREGSDARLAAAQDLQSQLEKILEGEPPYDLFVRWKPLHEQPIGWEPDINDGVRLNIRPFMSAELRKGGKKGAGILRWKPNIKWGKDRGKEPQSLRPRDDFPWFWSCPGDGTEADRTDFMGGETFDGNRWNDLHYTNAVKKAARERKGGERA